MPDATPQQMCRQRICFWGLSGSHSDLISTPQAEYTSPRKVSMTTTVHSFRVPLYVRGSLIRFVFAALLGSQCLLAADTEEIKSLLRKGKYAEALEQVRTTFGSDSDAYKRMRSWIESGYRRGLSPSDSDTAQSRTTEPEEPNEPGRDRGVSYGVSEDSPDMRSERNEADYNGDFSGVKFGGVVSNQTLTLQIPGAGAVSLRPQPKLEEVPFPR